MKTIQPITKLSARQRGQGMTEYIIIVALIAVAAIAVYQLFGKTVRNQTASIAQEVAGVNNSARTQAVTSAGNAATQANTNQTLETYVDQKTQGSR